MNQNPIQPLEVKMLTRFLIVMTILMMVVPACSPTEGTDVFEVGVEPATETSSNEAVKDELRPIMRAMFSGFVDDKVALLQFIQVPCANVEGLGGPPACPEGVAEGTALEVFPNLGAEGSWAAQEEMTTMFTNLNLQVKSLYAVYRETPNPNAEPYYQPGEYAMLFERELNDMPLPIVLQVTDGRIVRIDYRIGISPEDMLKEIPVEQIVIVPKEAKDWSETFQ
jgi:hypothetical protein